MLLGIKLDYNNTLMSKKTAMSSNVDTVNLNTNENNETHKNVKCSINAYSKIMKRKYPSITFQVLIIFLVCTSGLGLNFCQDGPFSMQSEIMSVINITAVKYDLLLSFTAIPNIFMAVGSGLIVDYFLGLGYSLVLFTFFVCIGQAVFLYGCYKKIFWLMIFGRVIFGLSSESVQVAINKYGAIYFKGKSMVLFFSSLQLFSKFAEFSNMFFMHDFYHYIRRLYPHLKNNEILGATFGLGFSVCIISFVTSIILGIIDRYLSPIKYQMISKHYEEKLFEWKDFFKMPLKLWLLCVICSLSYSATANYNSFSITIYSEKYLYSPLTSSKIQGYYIIVAIIVSPLLGAISSYIGYDTLILLAVFFLAMSCYTSLIFSFPSIISIIIPYGLSSSIRNVIIWPMVAYVVDKSRLGTAYGLMQSMQNISLSFTPIICGYIMENFGICLFLSFLISIVSVASTLLAILCYIDFIDPERVLLVSPVKRRELIK